MEHQESQSYGIRANLSGILLTASYTRLDYRSKERVAGVEPDGFYSNLRNGVWGDTQIGGDIRGKLVAIYYREVRLQDIPETLATPEQRESLRSHELALISSYIPDCLLNSLIHS